jgi:hypothetical protein
MRAVCGAHQAGLRQRNPVEDLLVAGELLSSCCQLAVLFLLHPLGQAARLGFVEVARGVVTWGSR